MSVNGGGDIVNEKELIDGCSFSVGWLLNSLKKNDKEFQQKFGTKSVKKVTSYDISGGRGVASVVLRCTLYFSDTEETYSTILKVPGLEVFKQIQIKYNGKCDMLDESLINRFNVNHQKECKFYNLMAPLLEGPIPKVYKTEDWILNEKEGCIHMEDLSMKGKTLTYFESANLNQVKSFIHNLARMHKSNLSVDPKIWKGEFVENDQFFTFYHDILETQIEPFLKECGREEEFRPLTEKYQKLRTNKDFLLYAQREAHLDLGLPTVIVHGDMHSGNLLWKINGNGEIQDELEAIVDWQIVHEGSPMADLARFLVHTTDGNIRRQAESFAFEYYLECLIKEFGGDSEKLPYTVEQLRKAYSYAFTLQAFFTLQLVPIFFAAVKDKYVTESEQKVIYQKGIQKALDAYQDLDKLYNDNGDLKDVFVKCGL